MKLKTNQRTLEQKTTDETRKHRNSSEDGSIVSLDTESYVSNSFF